MFEPLTQKTTPTTVYETIRHAILTGDIAPGAPLREAHIASAMGISRSPLREALGRLEEEELIEKIPFRGARVIQVSEETVAEIGSIRVLVEPYAVELSLPRLRGSESSTLIKRVEVLEEFADQADEADMIDAHLDLHRLFYSCSDHTLLLRMWTGWESKLRMFLLSDHRQFQHPADVASVHRELIDVILTGTLAEVREAVQNHVHGSPGVQALLTMPHLGEE